MNTTDHHPLNGDDWVISRMRSALDEISAPPSHPELVPLRAAPRRSHPTRWIAAAAATVAMIGGLAGAISRDRSAVDAADSTWTALPDDPLGPSFDRMMVAVDDQLYLFARDLVANPGSAQPSLIRAARLDVSTLTWELLADSEVIGGSLPVAVGTSIVFPTTGSADGGAVNPRGRIYPFGGLYDTIAGVWSPLPEPASNGGFIGAGVVGIDGGNVTAEAYASTP